MSNSVRIACLQLSSSANVAENLAFIEQKVSQAKPFDILVLPENFSQMPERSNALHVEAMAAPEAQVQSFLHRLAQQVGCHIVAGSLPITDASSVNKPYARCLLVSPDGMIGHYDKIHLFDVDAAAGVSIEQAPERYCESDCYQAGEISDQNTKPHGLEIDGKSLRIGASICYDLRFPELYRSFLAHGVELITVPAAFTYTTGEAHWRVLLRARAIENQCFVAAAAQVGKHANGRQTWGHSLIIGPWGDIIAERDHSPGLLYADLDLDLLTNVRRRFPALTHRRLGL